MLKIWGKLIKDNKIIKDEVVEVDIERSYQDNLKVCLIEICHKMDIEKPYWLPYNLDEYNKRGKTIFTQDNFIEKIDFDKFEIMELKQKK